MYIQNGNKLLHILLNLIVQVELKTNYACEMLSMKVINLQGLIKQAIAMSFANVM